MKGTRKKRGAVGFQACNNLGTEIMQMSDSSIDNTNNKCGLLAIEYAIKFVVEYRFLHRHDYLQFYTCS